MVAADLFTSFEDKLQDEGRLSAQGLKLRETFLAESGATPSSEMFKAVMERNPSAESLIRLSKSCIVFENQSK
jgi:Zn-dependent oligopeptidase